MSQSCRCWAAAALIERSGELLLAGEVKLIELNPVLMGAPGAIAVDASIRVRSSSSVDSEQFEPGRQEAGIAVSGP